MSESGEGPVADVGLAGGVGAEVAGPPKILARSVHEEPKVVLFENFVSQEEVDHLLKLCEGRWARSLVSKGKASELHGATDPVKKYGEEGVGDSRTSTSVHLSFDESIVVERIAARVASVTGSTLDQVEPLVLLRYEPGQYFRKHHDGSMRPSTVFVYLNSLTPEGGGQTLFPHLGFEVRPVAHTALMWHNRLENGEADMRLTHEAKPVIEGVKYAMNCFVGCQSQRDTSSIQVVQLLAEEEEA